ncbi:hypothetical protein F2Q69_00055707 [Brassica cretica]|uniref:Uncharacterized protein n=1 Tax=Brassica cretica TaxID=69181 RepID=A0A8S9MWV0_BRACR|nr:hypothetical protein F2Q69_00055707 [Brassica cretica]
MSVSKKLPQENEARLSFPWILWQILIARNSFCFEQRMMDEEFIFSKASEEATMWLNLILTSEDGPSSQRVEQPGLLEVILAYHRSAVSPIGTTFEAGLRALLCSSEDMHNNLHFKKSLHQFDHCQVMLVSEGINSIALEIASSVIADGKSLIRLEGYKLQRPAVQVSVLIEGNGTCAAKPALCGQVTTKSRLSRLFSWSLQPGNGLFGLAICIMAFTAEEWSFMVE